MCKRHRTASIIPRFVGCSVKDSLTLSSDGSSPRQSNVMQYLRSIMTQGPASPTKNNDSNFQVEEPPLDSNALENSLNDIILHDSGSRKKISFATELQKSEFGGTDIDNSQSSSQASPSKREHRRFHVPQHHKQAHCLACDGKTPPTQDPIVFG